MSDHQLLILVWAVTTLGAGLQVYAFAQGLIRQVHAARARKAAQGLMRALSTATIVAFRASPPGDADEDAPRVH